MEVLMYAAPHRVVHDLESLFYVLLFICTHLKGPHNDISHPPLFGKIEGPRHPSALRVWLEQTSFEALGHMKFSHMAHHLDIVILPHISPYFDPLKPHLRSIWRALHPQIAVNVPIGRAGSHSTASPMDIINVLKEVLRDPVLINEARSTKSTLGKRATPGDNSPFQCHWTPAPPNIQLLTAEPELGRTDPGKRQQKLLTKRRRG